MTELHDLKVAASKRKDGRNAITRRIQKSSPFLRLPPELRNSIYEDLFSIHEHCYEAWYKWDGIRTRFTHAPELPSTAGSAAEHSHRLAILRTCRQLYQDMELLNREFSLFQGSPDSPRLLLTFIPLAHRDVIEVVQIITSSHITANWMNPLRKLLLELGQFKGIKRVNLVFREWARLRNPSEVLKTFGKVKIQLEKLKVEMERTLRVPIIDTDRLHMGRMIWTGRAWTHEMQTWSNVMLSLS